MHQSASCFLRVLLGVTLVGMPVSPATGVPVHACGPASVFQTGALTAAASWMHSPLSSARAIGLPFRTHRERLFTRGSDGDVLGAIRYGVVYDNEVRAESTEGIAAVQPFNRDGRARSLERRITTYVNELLANPSEPTDNLRHALQAYGANGFTVRIGHFFFYEYTTWEPNGPTIWLDESIAAPLSSRELYAALDKGVINIQRARLWAFDGELSSPERWDLLFQAQTATLFEWIINQVRSGGYSVWEKTMMSLNRDGQQFFSVVDEVFITMQAIARMDNLGRQQNFKAQAALVEDHAFYVKKAILGWLDSAQSGYWLGWHKPVPPGLLWRLKTLPSRVRRAV